MDFRSYLLWLSLNTLVKNGDTVDEVFYFEVLDDGEPHGRLEIMAWDYDDLMAEPAHPKTSLVDPLLYACEATIDRAIQQDAFLYQQFRFTLRDLLSNHLTEEHLKNSLDELRARVNSIDTGESTDVQDAAIRHRNDQIATFERQLLARRAELLSKTN